jgi:hypothetical protein
MMWSTFCAAAAAVSVTYSVGVGAVTVELWDLIFQHKMVTKRVVCQFGNKPVVLVQVVAGVRQNEVGWDVLQRLEVLLDLQPDVREIAAAKRLD